MPSTRPVPVRLPHPCLPFANWADAFEIDIPDKRLTAHEAARLALGRLPGWAKRLMALRNVLARQVGLKTGAEPPAPDEGERIGMFPVLKVSEGEVVLGLDDWHLDFRIVIEVVPAYFGTRVRATTLVERKNLFGKVYIGVVTPFHRLIVPAALRGAL